MIVEWRNQKEIYERISELIVDDPVSCAEYGKKHDRQTWMEETQ